MIPPVGLADYRDHRPLALDGRNLWENHGWMVWDRPNGEDLLLWLSPYRLIGHQRGGPFSVDDISLSQTLVLRGRFEAQARRRMADTPYLAVGYDLGDHLPAEALQISVGPREATWQIGRRMFTAAPPIWRITGEHAGVDVDLTLTAMGPPFWLADPSVPVEKSEERWFVHCARARGIVRHRGATIEVNGYASHERHVHCGTRYNPPVLLAKGGVTWHSGSADGVQIIFLLRPALGLGWARLVFDDAVAEFRAPESTCTTTEVDHWVDPQSRLSVPCAWRASFSGPAGSLEVDARAFARAYYLWPNFKYGATVLYWWLADADVRYNLADGRRNNQAFQYIVHDNRLLYRQHIDD